MLSYLLPHHAYKKPSEMGIFTSLAKCDPAGVLVRNFSGLEYFRDKGIPVTADFSFNATNPLTVKFFKEQGVERIAVSYDCNREQLVNLTSAVAGDSPRSRHSSTYANVPYGALCVLLGSFSRYR